MRFISLSLAAVSGLAVFLGPVLSPLSAQARIVAKINLGTQTMSIRVNGRKRYVWPVSSGKSGYLTPRGSFRPTFVKEMHYSTKYNDAPMPYSVFFNGGIAVHGTNTTWKLGQPASHGCVRLSVDNARTFHDLVVSHGKKSTLIKVTGRTPSGSKTRRATRRKNRYNGHYSAPYYYDDNAYPSTYSRGNRYYDYNY